MRITLFAALLAAAATAAVSWITIADLIPEKAPREATKSAAAARLGETNAADESYDTPFEKEMLRDVSEYKTQDNVASVDATAVNPTPDADLAATTEQCLQHLLTKYSKSTSVQCYVYTSTATYDFKNYHETTAKEYRSAIANLCWMYRGVQVRGSKAELTDLTAYYDDTWGSQGCPDPTGGAA